MPRKHDGSETLPNQSPPMPEVHRNHDRLQQDVASLNATVRKVEAEQMQLAGAISALANKFDALSDRIAQLGKPNYQAAGFIAAVLMAFGGLVWNFSWEQIKLNRAAIDRIIDARNEKAIEDARFAGGLDEKLKATADGFQLWRTRVLESTKDLTERMDDAEKDVARMDTDNTWQNVANETQAKLNKLATDVALLQSQIEKEKP